MMMPNNAFQGNPMGQIQFQQQQQQQQMGMINPPPNQIVGSGNNTIPNRSPFMNVPNQFFPLQNAMRPSGQFFGPQNPNPVAMNNQLMNSSQPGGGGGQFFSHNPINPIIPYNTQNFMLPNGQFHSPMNPIIPYNNQNATLPNGGQFCLQGPNQNMVQFVQMQVPNYAQVVPGNLQLFQNQVAHGMPPQNPNFPGNQQFGLVHSSGAVQHGNQEQQKLISPIMGMTATNQSPNTGAQFQGNSSIQQNFGTVQPQQAQNFRPPGFTKPQGNLGNNNGVNNVNTNWKSSRNKNFTRPPKNDASLRGFKPQLQRKHNGQGKTRFHDQHGGKGCKNDGSTKFNDVNSTNRTCVERKPLRLIYTEQEIRQWREARKENYPSKAKLKKKVEEREAKLRRQQLKEILAKQAELGVEVAEIPSSYLSDSEQGHRKEGNKREWGKKGKFKNKFNKRGISRQNERFTKKQKSGDHDLSNINKDENSGTPFIKKEPTLLQKLMVADLRRDKSHLLQVFRFMVANSFFRDWPEKPLRFPSIIIKETGADGEMNGENAAPVENSINDSYDDDNNDNDETNAQADGGGKNFSGAAEGSEKKVVEPEEEEGEIID